MVDNRKFGEFIRKLRKEKQMTQKDLANKLNISDKTVSKWEQGKAFPDLTLWEPLASELGVNIIELFAGERTVETVENNMDEEFIKNEIARGINEILQMKRKKTFGVILLTSILIFLILIGVKWLKEKTTVQAKLFEVTVEEVHEKFWKVKGQITDLDGRTGRYYVNLDEAWYENNPIQVERGDKLCIVYRESWRNRTLEEETYLQDIMKVEKMEDTK